VWIIDRISTRAVQIVEQVALKKQNRAQGAV